MIRRLEKEARRNAARRTAAAALEQATAVETTKPKTPNIAELSHVWEVVV